MKKEIINKVSRSFCRSMLKIKKHSPAILTIAGSIGSIAGIALACKSTIDFIPEIEKAKKDIDCIHEVMDNKEEYGNEYTEENMKKDLTIVYARTAMTALKIYFPVILVEGVSIASFIASHKISAKRNLALAAAYATADKSFKEYREKVVNKFGKEIDRELRYNIKAKDFEKEFIDDDGNTRTETVTEYVKEDDNYSGYARCFNEWCLGWEKNAELNLFTVRQIQKYCNDILEKRGHLFLNEVYDMFGFPRTVEGQSIGWIYDKNITSKIDFGIYDIRKKSAQDFVNGYERCVWLDFNVDGNILNLI